MTGVTIAPPTATDRAGWEKLYQGYRRHYGQAPDGDAANTVWNWITGDTSTLEGRVARDGGGRVLGLIHFRTVPRPFSARRADTSTTCSSPKRPEEPGWPRR